MPKTLSQTFDDQVKSGHITQSEANLISSFIFEIQAQRGSANSTMLTRAWSLIRVAVTLHTFGANLENLDTDQVFRLLNLLRQNGSSKNYLNDQVKALKRFLLWRIENGVTTLNEKKIRGIRAPGMDWSTKKSTDMLSKDEILTVIKACTSSRDRAIVSMLYDGSLRPVDLRQLTWSAVTFDEYGVMIRTAAKTGNERTIRLTFSAPYLSQWRADYPGEPDGFIPVFVSHRSYRSNNGEHAPLEMDAIVRLFRGLREKTGIQKLKPSLLRPSRITHDVEDGYDASYLMLKNWGTLKTPMLQVYAKPSENYITNYALEKAGMQTAAKKRERSKALDPITCPRCQTLNPPGKKFCGQCGLSLTEEAHEQVTNSSDKIRQLLTQHPEVQPVFLNILTELMKPPSTTQ